MAIDVHAHIIVPEILRSAAPDEGWRPAVYWQDSKQIIDFGGKRIQSAIYEFVDIEAILAHQPSIGVDQVVLSPWVSIVRYDADQDDALRSSRIQNEALAVIAQQHPRQVLALGTVPMQAPETAARELESIMRQPGIVGVEIAASVGRDYLGHERFRPFWASAEATGAVVFIHPTTRGFNLPVFDEYYLWNTVGNPLETAITAAHMVMAGVMEQHPRLKVVLAHGGGALMALRGRLRHAHSFQPQAHAILNENPDDSLRRFYYDSLTHDPDLLLALIDFAGEDHVVLGSDYPFDMGDDHAVNTVRNLPLPDTTKEKILERNARALFDRNSERPALP